MKNPINLCLTFLILAVLGCSCPERLQKLANQGGSAPTPAPTLFPTSSPTARETPVVSTKKGEYDVTLAKYNKITVGMSRSEVESLLGGKGAEISNNVGGGVRFTVVKWEGDNFKSIILTFKNDKVLTRIKVGLK